MRTYREIFEMHGKMVMDRSGETRRRISAALEKEGSLPLTVGACQMRNRCGGERTKTENLERMLAAAAGAAAQGVRMLAFPEMCLPGYFTPAAGTAEEATAANHDLADVVSESPSIRALQLAAREHCMVLTFGFCEKTDDAYYNAVGVIDADGSWLGTRRKAPLFPWRYETESFSEPGPEHRAAVFETAYAVVGVSNCFDGEFPESIRRMRLAGAEILLWSNAALGDSRIGTSHRINHSGAHAQANKMWVVCCNCAAGNSSGTSVIVSENGEPLVILPPDEEALAVATIDLSLTKSWEPWRSRVDMRGYR